MIFLLHIALGIIIGIILTVTVGAIADNYTRMK